MTPTVMIGEGGIHETGEIEYPVMTADWMEQPVRTEFPGVAGEYELVPVGGSLADDPAAVEAWFGENIWAADDFGGLGDDTLVGLFDLILPGWAKFTWQGKRAAERGEDG